MSNYIISPDGKLYYAEDDYLQHWKYIKREKVNGKWRYYYHDDKYEDAKKNYEDAKARSDEKRAKSDSIKEYAKDSTNPRADSALALAQNKAERQAERAEKKTAKAQDKYDKAQEKYDKSLGLKIANGLNKLSDPEKSKRQDNEKDENKSDYVSASADLEKALTEYETSLRDYTRQAESIKYLAEKYGADSIKEVETDKANKMRTQVKESVTKLAEARDRLKEEADKYKNSEYYKKSDPDYERKVASMERRVAQITEMIDNSKIKPKASYIHKAATSVDTGKNFIDKLFSKKKKR